MIRLICIDLDGVLVPADNFWLAMHKAYGTLEQGADLAKQYQQTDYERLVQEVVRLWQGKDAAPYLELAHSIRWLPGVDELFVELDRFKDDSGERVQRAIISGGCFEVAERIAKEFHIDFIFANQLGVANGKISGEYRWPVGASGESKRNIIEQLCDDFDILPQDVLMIGDSEGDLEAFRIAGVSIAFNTRSQALKAAATFVVNSNSPRDIVPVLRQLREETGTASSGTVKL